MLVYVVGVMMGRRMFSDVPINPKAKSGISNLGLGDVDFPVFSSSLPNVMLGLAYVSAFLPRI